MDAVGSNIRIDTKGNKVMRVLPRNNDEVNEEWISDKTRFFWDGLSLQRIDKPYLRENGKLRQVSWKKAIDVASDKLLNTCLLYTSPSPRDGLLSRMPSSA